MQPDARHSAPHADAPRPASFASRALVLFAAASWIAGNSIAMLTDARPASNALAACVVWALGLVAAGVALALGASIALSLASYPEAARRQREMERATPAAAAPQAV